MATSASSAYPYGENDTLPSETINHIDEQIVKCFDRTDSSSSQTGNHVAGMRVDGYTWYSTGGGISLDNGSVIKNTSGEAKADNLVFNSTSTITNKGRTNLYGPTYLGNGDDLITVNGDIEFINAISTLNVDVLTAETELNINDAVLDGDMTFAAPTTLTIQLGFGDRATPANCWTSGGSVDPKFYSEKTATSDGYGIIWDLGKIVRPLMVIKSATAVVRPVGGGSTHFGLPANLPTFRLFHYDAATGPTSLSSVAIPSGGMSVGTYEADHTMTLSSINHTVLSGKYYYLVATDERGTFALPGFTAKEATITIESSRFYKGR